MDTKDKNSTGHNEEIAKRQAVEQTLGDTEEMFSLLVNGVKDYAIFALDVNGFILTWNTGASRLKGYEASEVIGSHFSKFYTKPDIDKNHPAFELKEALKNGSYEEEGWRVKKDGSQIWANVVITALRDENGVHKGFAKVTRDLTERKIASDKLQNAYESLERRVEERTAELAEAKASAERAVQARDEFLSIASHELKTPLTSLKLQIQMRKRKILKAGTTAIDIEKMKEMVDDDDKQINRIGRLVDDMLDITHITAGKLTLDRSETDLDELAQDIVRRLRSHFEEQHIHLSYTGTPGIIGMWDQYRVEQIFTNLLTNAIKYGNGKPVVVTVAKSGDMAILTVRDYGIGIDEEDHERVFQQFERAISASSISGLGLGLFIVKQIIESHQGTISIESHRGQGTSFIVKLPLK